MDLMNRKLTNGKEDLRLQYTQPYSEKQLLVTKMLYYRLYKKIYQRIGDGYKHQWDLIVMILSLFRFYGFKTIWITRTTTDCNFIS